VASTAATILQLDLGMLFAHPWSICAWKIQFMTHILARRTANWLGFLAFLLCLVSGTAQADSPFQNLAGMYYQLLLSGKTDLLEQMAAREREHNSKTGDGQPMLAAVYAGLAGRVTSGGCTTQLTPQEWDRRGELLAEWRKTNPSSVTAEIAYASFYVEKAWAIRGGGYANSVEEEAWAPFKDNIETGRKMLEKASSAARADPGWYATMLTVGLSQGWEVDRFDALYREAQRRHPRYLPIYFAAAAYHSSRWYGSEKELRAFVEQAVTSTSSVLGESLYARLNWALWTRDMFVNGQADWSRMQAGFERMVADNPDDSWNLNNYAKFACLARDRKTLSSILTRIGLQKDTSAWEGVAPDFYEVCSAFAMQSSAKN
jgi:hypothetical protein